MPSGTSKTLKCIVRRDSSPQVEIYLGGRFLEVYLNGILAGKVTRMAKIICPDELSNSEHCSGECIRLRHQTILLTDEEATDIAFELSGQ